MNKNIFSVAFCFWIGFPIEAQQPKKVPQVGF
jgi:hypothetical protein